MAEVVLSKEADEDSVAILDDLSTKVGARTAGRYEADFDAIYDRLAGYPEIGAPRSRLGRRVRICLALPYVVIYEFDRKTNVVTILRIVHGRRKIDRGLLRRPKPRN